MMSKFRHWIPAIFYMAFIFYLSSRPAPEELRLFPIIAKLKLVHMIEYGMLFLLFRYALLRTSKYNWFEIFALAISMTVLFGLIDELHQVFVPSRTASLVDVVADGAGAAFAQIGLKITPNLSISSFLIISVIAMSM